VKNKKAREISSRACLQWSWQNSTFIWLNLGAKKAHKEATRGYLIRRIDLSAWQGKPIEEL